MYNPLGLCLCQCCFESYISPRTENKTTEAKTQDNLVWDEGWSIKQLNIKEQQVANSNFFKQPFYQVNILYTLWHTQMKVSRFQRSKVRMSRMLDMWRETIAIARNSYPCLSDFPRGLQSIALNYMNGAAYGENMWGILGLPAEHTSVPRGHCGYIFWCCFFSCFLPDRRNSVSWVFACTLPLEECKRHIETNIDKISSFYNHLHHFSWQNHLHTHTHAHCMHTHEWNMQACVLDWNANNSCCIFLLFIYFFFITSRGLLCFHWPSQFVITNPSVTVCLNVTWRHDC